MFENLQHFDQSARRVLALAHEEAQAIGHEQLDSDHVLLALLRDSASPASCVLRHLSITAEGLREEMRSQVPARPHLARGDLPATPRFKELLQAALCESVRRRERAVTATHLLVALAENGTSLAGQTLAAAGADPQSLRDRAASVERDATLPAKHCDVESPAKDPGRQGLRGGQSLRLSARGGEPALRPRRRDRPRRLLRRLVKAALLLQLLVFSMLTLKGWGAVPSREVDPPRMERIGPPPGLIETYASLSNITYPLEHGSQRQIATAVFVGTPGDWGGPEPTPSSLNVLGQSLGTTILQFSAGSHNTILFVVPSAALQRGSLYVVVKGDRYRLTVVINESSMGFAVVSAAVDNRLLSVFDSSLVWLTLPVPASTSVPLMLLRREPGGQAYVLTHGTLDVTSHGGEVASAVGGVTLGTPVVAITPNSSGLAGFLEQSSRGPSRFVATSVIANLLHAVGPSVSGGS